MSALQATNVDALKQRCVDKEFIVHEYPGDTAGHSVVPWWVAMQLIDALRQQEEALKEKDGEIALRDIDAAIHEKEIARLKYECGVLRTTCDCHIVVIEDGEADVARLREAIEKAPCPQQEGDVRAICYCKQGVKIDCWKRQALEPTKGSE